MNLHYIAVECCILVLQVSTNVIHFLNNTKIIAVPGTKIRFSCPVNCTNRLPVWSLHGFVISDGLNVNPTLIQKNRLSVNQSCDEQTHYLDIFNSTKGDEGTYCCEIQLSQYCSVLEIAELIIELDGKNSLQGVEGEDFNLTCHVTKDLQRRVHLQMVQNHSIIMEDTKNRLIVTLNATKELHLEQFSCVAKFDGPDIPLEKNVILSISYKPRVKIQILPNSNLIVGTNATFVCRYDSNPNPVSIEWKKNEKLLSTNDTFVISNTTRADAGSYQCIVNNGKFSGVDNIPVSVLYGDVVQLRNDLLYCNTTGFPTNYTFVWEHQTTTGKHIRFLKQTINEIQLDINENTPTYKSNGRYVCTWQNVQIAYKDVFFSGKPTCLNEDSELFGHEDSNAFLTVPVYISNFSGFDWWKGDLRITNSSKYVIYRYETLTTVDMYNTSVELESTTVALEIKQLTENDFNSQYAVTVYSKNGNCTCKVILRLLETFHHKGLLAYVLTTFICTVVMLFARTIYAYVQKRGE